MITTSGPTSEKPTRNPWTPDDAGSSLVKRFRRETIDYGIGYVPMYRIRQWKWQSILMLHRLNHFIVALFRTSDMKTFYKDIVKLHKLVGIMLVTKYCTYAAMWLFNKDLWAPVLVIMCYCEWGEWTSCSILVLCICIMNAQIKLSLLWLLETT